MPPVPDTSRTRRIVRRDILLLLAVAGFTICMMFYYWLMAPQITGSSYLKSGTSLYAHPRAFPEFSLTDHRGQEFSNHQMKHTWSFVLFGYTHCPDICPLALSTMDRVLETLVTRDGIPALGIFISVDPQRDTQQRLSEFVQYSSREIIGLTGSEAELENLGPALDVAYSMPAGPENVNYLVDHSSYLFLVAPDGNLIALFGTPHDNERIIDDFHTLNTSYGNLQVG